MRPFSATVHRLTHSPRPLPDERPRQSVANLIGRFENQTKRQPPVTGSPRSTSVVSHNTGDSVNNEQKEKRDWPPKSISERIASLETFPLRLHPPLPASHSAPQPSTATTLLEQSTPSGPSSVPPADDPKPVIEVEAKIERKADADNPAASVTKPPVPSTKTHSQTVAGKSTVGGAKNSASKLTPQTTSKTSAPRHSLGTPAIQPLKPQHSGLSTASTASARKATSPTRITARSTASAAATSRPKTPSSGLFAPTAASLAKSRNAQTASTPAIPVRKSTSTANASDRLSKPTAASLSRARSPAAPVPQPTRSNIKSAATTRIPTKTALKAAATSTPAKQPSPAQKSAIPMTLAAATDVPNAGGASNNAVDLDVDEKQEPINGHALERHSEDITPLREATGQPTESEEHVMEEGSDKAMEDVQPESDADASIDFANEGTLSSPSDIPPEPQVGIVEEQQASEQESKIDRGDDIENLVNLLESASLSKARAISIASIPDEVHEIPDEE